MPSPAPTSNTAPFLSGIAYSRPRSHLVCRYTSHGFFPDHAVNRCIAVAQLMQNLAGMLTNTRRRSPNLRGIDLKASCRLRLPDAADQRLVEFGEDTSRDYLLVLNDLTTTQD